MCKSCLIKVSCSYVPKRSSNKEQNSFQSTWDTFLHGPKPTCGRTSIVMADEPNLHIGWNRVHIKIILTSRDPQFWVGTVKQWKMQLRYTTKARAISRIWAWCNNRITGKLLRRWGLVKRHTLDQDMGIVKTMPNPWSRWYESLQCPVGPSALIPTSGGAEADRGGSRMPEVGDRTSMTWSMCLFSLDTSNLRSATTVST